MVIGVLAWPIRYFLFMIPNLPVIISSLTLHGFGYAFFFVTSQIYVNMKASDYIRASAQAMLTFFTLGVGNYLGTLFTGWVWKIYTTYKVDALGQFILDEKDHKIPIYDWSSFFLIPGLLCTVMAIIFLLFFKDDKKASEAELKTI